MPTFIDPETFTVVHVLGPKEPDTIEHHQQKIMQLWEGWGRWYEAEPYDVLARVRLHQRRIQELRAGAAEAHEEKEQP